jgi:cytochrome c-type biogenesis protein CcmH/NrfG
MLPGLRAAVATHPDDPVSRFKLGSALFSLGLFGQAVSELKVAVRLDSTMTAPWIALGRASYYAGLPQEAARAYWNVMRIDPSVLSSPGIDRVVLDAALTIEARADTVSETTN